MVGVREWRTVIDLECDGRFMKEVVRRGEGHSRLARHDEVAYWFRLGQGERVAVEERWEEPVKLEEEYIGSVPALVWKILYSMKAKERVRVVVADGVVRELEGERYGKIAGEV